MKKETKALLTKYLICIGVALLITIIVFAIKGFFTNDLGVNIQILADGFFVSGILMTMVAGLLFVSGEGEFIGIGFVLRNVILTFIPMGRTKHERYSDYRDRKLGQLKKSSNSCILFTGLIFLAISFIFNIIWYNNFYNIVA